VLFHFSEDPTIEQFVPHVAVTAEVERPFVWAVDASREAAYWFPRDCPRAMAWLLPTTTAADRDRVLGPGPSRRVHAVEYGWVDAIKRCELFRYRLPGAPFRLVEGPAPHAYVAEETVTPVTPPEPVGDLLERHAAAGIELRLLENLWPWWDEVSTTTVGYSAIRLANARPR
jgi:hypothetical protein